MTKCYACDPLICDACKKPVYENDAAYVCDKHDSTYDQAQHCACGIAIGANAIIRFTDDQTEVEVYISFGDYDEEFDADIHGVKDERIFYYASGESELRSLMDAAPTADFIVLEYELVFGED